MPGREPHERDNKGDVQTTSIATSVAGGLLAGAVFNQVWQRLSDTEQEPPDPKDPAAPVVRRSPRLRSRA